MAKVVWQREGNVLMKSGGVLYSEECCCGENPCPCCDIECTTCTCEDIPCPRPWCMESCSFDTATGNWETVFLYYDDSEQDKPTPIIVGNIVGFECGPPNTDEGVCITSIEPEGTIYTYRNGIAGAPEPNLDTWKQGDTITVQGTSNWPTNILDCCPGCNWGFNVSGAVSPHPAMSFQGFSVPFDCDTGEPIGGQAHSTVGGQMQINDIPDHQEHEVEGVEILEVGVADDGMWEVVLSVEKLSSNAVVSFVDNHLLWYATDHRRRRAHAGQMMINFNAGPVEEIQIHGKFDPFAPWLTPTLRFNGKPLITWAFNDKEETTP